MGITDLLAKAAAAATTPGGGGGAPMDPSMDPMAQPVMDPIEEDNIRLTNILNNLKLRTQLLEQQNILADMQRANKLPKGAAPTMAQPAGKASEQINPAATGGIKAFNKSLQESAIFGPDVFQEGNMSDGVTGRAVQGGR